MIAWFSILAVMPLDVVSSEVIKSSLANIVEEILVRVFNRQAEGPRLGLKGIIILYYIICK